MPFEILCPAVPPPSAQGELPRIYRGPGARRCALPRTLRGGGGGASPDVAGGALPALGGKLSETAARAATVRSGEERARPHRGREAERGGGAPLPGTPTAPSRCRGSGAAGMRRGREGIKAPATPLCCGWWFAAFALRPSLGRAPTPGGGRLRLGERSAAQRCRWRARRLRTSPVGTAAEGERSGAEHAGLAAAEPAPRSSAMRRPPGAPGKAAPAPAWRRAGRRGWSGVRAWALRGQRRSRRGLSPLAPQLHRGAALSARGKREEGGGAGLGGGGIPGPQKLCPPAEGCDRHCPSRHCWEPPQRGERLLGCVACQRSSWRRWGSYAGQLNFHKIWHCLETGCWCCNWGTTVCHCLFLNYFIISLATAVICNVGARMYLSLRSSMAKRRHCCFAEGISLMLFSEG